MAHFSLIWQSIASLFFPRTCPCCNRAISDDEWICRSCLRTLPYTEQAALRGNRTEMLFMQVPNFERGAAYLFFDKGSPVQHIVKRIKYHDCPELGYYLGQEAARSFCQSSFFDGIDLIAPVPLHPKRFRDRGYNQAEWIARGLAEITHLPLDTTHLMRTHDNPYQAQTSGEERKKNVAGIFSVQHPEQWYKKHILLVDDVITTGSTLESCMKAMRKCRGCKVSVFSIGKAR